MAVKRNIPAKHSYHRPLLADILPFEVPPTFSNGGFFNFVTSYNVRYDQHAGEPVIVWNCSSSKVDEAIQTIFNTVPSSSDWPKSRTIRRDGKIVVERYWKMPRQSLRTIPYGFNIAHKEREFRRLSIIHPRNQIAVADFYARNSSQILHYAGLSDISIRFPVSVAKSVKFSDRLFAERKSQIVDTVEQQAKEYENIGSYFSYKYYSNIFKFYEHYKYHNAERKFDFLLKLDVSKCFDSIYTHSLPWSTLGTTACKDHLGCSKLTFGGRFDKLLQDMNQGETNGIVIGPEFSRIFAEIILQKVDRNFVEAMTKHDLVHRTDFQAFRYVDDYFVFCSSRVEQATVERELSFVLREMKLGINVAKTEKINKPMITNLTIAKNAVRDVFSRNIHAKCVEFDNPADPDDPYLVFQTKVSPSNLIVEFKSVLKQFEIEYKNILNYTFAALERNTKGIFDKHESSSELHRSERELAKSVLGVLEFAFFVYAADPRVNISVRLARLISLIVDELHRLGLNRDLKNQVLKFAFDNLSRQLKKSSAKYSPNIEVMYLVLALKKLGRGYLVPEEVLSSYFGFSMDKDTGEYNDTEGIDYFAATVLLNYSTSKGKYAKLREAAENSLLARFSRRSAYASQDTEQLLIYLDMITCPFVSDTTKVKLASAFGHSIFQLWSLQACSDYWFTDWHGFDLSLSLDKKRTREVY